MSSIEINSQFEQVLRFVNQTNQSLFLTGKAGTGKTTLLKYIREKTFKQISIVAPTGVAAISAGGSTIHSFFQFPFTPFLSVSKPGGEPDLSKNNLPTLKYNSQRLAIFRNLELLVIDEVSMVRADLLDQIDQTLRITRKKHQQAFGGVQVMLIGDMYQLPPVVQQEEWQLLKSIYQSPYFFESMVIKNNPPVYIELEKIYRQSDQTFIELLNKVRNNALDAESLHQLNAHYKATISQSDYENNITLTTHNRKADEINARNLHALPGKKYTFKSELEGTFSERNFPAEEALTLKKGTRVMFLKNNVEKNYYNGKIGVVTYLDQEKIKVTCDEDRYEIEVSKETWTNISYKIDKSTKHIEEEVLGTFQQYPLRLAWAITIHKSQGLTFEKLIIDAAEAFSAGQVYVALSRCRSLSGLTLSSKINSQSLLNDRLILNFADTKHNHEQVTTIFSDAQRDYIKTVLMNLFDLSEQVQSRNDLAGIAQLYKSRLNSAGGDWVTLLGSKIDTLSDVSRKFKSQLEVLIQQTPGIETNANLQTRIKQASAYFSEEYKKCLDVLKNCTLLTESKEAATALNENLQTLFESLYAKYYLVQICEKGFVFHEFVDHKMKLVYPEIRINTYASAKNAKVSAEVQYPELYRALLLKRDEICNDEQKPIYLVANTKTLIELTNYLPETAEQLLNISGFGEAKVEAVGEYFLKIIREFMIQNGLESAMDQKASKKKKTKKEKKANDPITHEDGKKVSTKEQTYALFRQGLKPEEIAKRRGFALSTIQGHLIPYITNGDIGVDDLVSKEKQKLINDALVDFNYEAGINPIKNKLPDYITYSEIRYMLANRLRTE
ncbi:MAG: helix-turn-helix domain-containing protein [bacterium]|nr:helix-turn-helix domain-containing protein [bacterium]